TAERWSGQASGLEPLDCGRDPLVGGGEGHAYVTLARRSVEGARGHEDPPFGEPGDQVPAVGLRAFAGGPQVEAGLTVLHGEAGDFERGPEVATSSGVPG